MNVNAKATPIQKASQHCLACGLPRFKLKRGRCTRCVKFAERCIAGGLTTWERMELYGFARPEESID